MYTAFTSTASGDEFEFPAPTHGRSGLTTALNLSSSSSDRAMRASRSSSQPLAVALSLLGLATEDAIARACAAVHDAPVWPDTLAIERVELPNLSDRFLQDRYAVAMADEVGGWCLGPDRLGDMVALYLEAGAGLAGHGRSVCRCGPVDGIFLMRLCLSAMVLIALAVGMATPSQAGPGRLVIGGGAVSPDNAEVWQALIAGLPDPDHDTIAVIAAASGEPIASYESFRNTLAAQGIDRSRIVLVRAAVIDDDTTPEDESLWVSGGTDPANLEMIQAAGGIWFTGGDQARTAQVLFDDQGTPSPLLLAVRQRLDQGAVVGGSSAGAAIQPEVMIVRGDGLTALLDPIPVKPDPDEMETGALILAPGAGFFRFGLIDQHFDRQARLGRLVRATLRSEAHRFGYGIDENTALIVDIAQSKARVVGKGGVTLIDDENAEQAGRPTDFPADGLRLSLAASGDQIDLMTGRVTPAPFRTAVSMPTLDDTEPRLVGQGALIPSSTLAERIDADLIGGRSASISLWTFTADRRAVNLTLTRGAHTRAWFGRAADGEGGMTVENLDLSVTSGRVQFEGVLP